MFKNWRISIVVIVLGMLLCHDIFPFDRPAFALTQGHETGANGDLYENEFRNRGTFALLEIKKRNLASEEAIALLEAALRRENVRIKFVDEKPISPLTAEPTMGIVTSDPKMSGRMLITIHGRSWFEALLTRENVKSLDLTQYSVEKFLQTQGIDDPKLFDGMKFSEDRYIAWHQANRLFRPVQETTYFEQLRDLFDRGITPSYADLESGIGFHTGRCFYDGSQDIPRAAPLAIVKTPLEVGPLDEAKSAYKLLVDPYAYLDSRAEDFDDRSYNEWPERLGSVTFDLPNTSRTRIYTEDVGANSIGSSIPERSPLFRGNVFSNRMKLYPPYYIVKRILPHHSGEPQISYCYYFKKVFPGFLLLALDPFRSVPGDANQLMDMLGELTPEIVAFSPINYGIFSEHMRKLVSRISNRILLMKFPDQTSADRVKALAPSLLNMIEQLRLATDVSGKQIFSKEELDLFRGNVEVKCKSLQVAN